MFGALGKAVKGLGGGLGKVAGAATGGALGKVAGAAAGLGKSSSGGVAGGLMGKIRSSAKPSATKVPKSGRSMGRGSHR